MTNLREILIPEDLISEMEKLINILKNGDKILYSIGKKFGYRYALISNYPIAKNEKEFSKFSFFLVRYLESIYAQKIKYKIDFSNRIFKFEAIDWIVCNKNGIGHLLLEGTGAGMLSYAFQDKSIEAVQTKCQGRGDEYCELICAPYDYLQKKSYKTLKENNLSDLEINVQTYNNINPIRKTSWSKNSLKAMIDTKYFKCEHGLIKTLNERFILIESSIMYLLEKELKKLPDALDILWQVSYNWGESLLKRREN